MSTGRKDAVLGFAFDPEFRTVALVRKEHPEWMKGLWNAPGGHVAPDESAVQAVAREFFEETGQFTLAEMWVPFLTLDTPDYNLFCFWAVLDPLRVMTTGAEQAVVDAVDYVVEGRDLVRNTLWMLLMAREAARTHAVRTAIYRATEF